MPQPEVVLIQDRWFARIRLYGVEFWARVPNSFPAVNGSELTSACMPMSTAENVKPRDLPGYALKDW